MNIEQIKKYIEPIILQSLDGQDIENNKIECKSKWWNLKSLSGLNEFLKDTCAIVNTFGLDGFIIIGYNDKTKEFSDSQFSDSECKDNAEIRHLLIKHVDTVFDLNTFDIDLNGNKLSILHIPPSIEKPHVLKVYKQENKSGVGTREEFNKIYIRKNSANHVASKNDIDIMYYDRKNIVLEYKLAISVSKQSLVINGNGMGGVYDNMTITPTLTFENQGTRPIAIVDMEFSFSEFTDPNPDEIYSFKLSSPQPIIVPINQIINCFQRFIDTGNSPKSIAKAMATGTNRRNIIVNDITLITNSGDKMILPLVAY